MTVIKRFLLLALAALCLMLLAAAAPMLPCKSPAVFRRAPKSAVTTAAADTYYWDISDGKFTITADPNDVSDTTKSFAADSIYNLMSKTPWYDQRLSITSAEVRSGVAPQYMSYWFYNCENMTSVDLSGVDTSNTKGMSYMFSRCGSLSGTFGKDSATIILGDKFTMKNVRSMESMFAVCEKLTSVDFTGIKVGNGSTMEMGGVFSACYDLSSVNFASVNVKPISMGNMFRLCGKLKSVDLSLFDCSSLTFATGIFYSCNALAEIKTPKLMGETPIKLPDYTKFWNGTADVVEITGSDINKTLKKHTSHSGGSSTCSSKKVCAICNMEYGSFAPHTFGDWHDEIAPTCSAEGRKGYKDCTVCRRRFDRSGNELNDLTISAVAAAHTWGDWAESRAATCTENGEETRVCAHNAEHKETRSIFPKGHKWSVASAAEATCTSAGSVTTVCTACGTRNIAGVPALGHDCVSHAAHAATCTEAGCAAYETCSRCEYTTYSEIDALGHDFAENYTVDKMPTCTEKGSMSRHCSRCDEMADVTEIKRKAHSMAHVAAKAATEEEDGNVEYWSCSECGGNFTDADGETELSEVVVPKLDGEEKTEGGLFAGESVGLTAGAVAGISVGAVVAAVIAAYIALYFALYRRGKALGGKAWRAIFMPLDALFGRNKDNRGADGASDETAEDGSAEDEIIEITDGIEIVDKDK